MKREKKIEVIELCRLEKDYFDNIAWRYDDLCKISSPHARLFNNKRVRELTEIINKHNSAYVLEIGCGTGQTLVPLSKNVKATIVGLDISRRMLEVAKRKELNVSNTHLVVADAFHLPFKKIFDLVYCIETLHHMPNISQIFNELNRVLRVSGRIYIEEPHDNVLFRIARMFKVHICSEKSPWERARWRQGFRLPVQILASNFIIERIQFRGYIGLFLGPKLRNVTLSKVLMCVDECLSKIPPVRKFALRIMLCLLSKQSVIGY
jgi:ubiquinone/menaquinone biosynthesis C-methylase UbiE